MLNLSYFVVGFCIRSMCIALSSFFCLNSSLFACNDDLPNIVFILSDDHRWDQMGCAGHEIVRTPNIDRLAADGVRFKNMFVTTSICAASRASIFTGMYERGHRFTFGTKPLAKTLVDSSYPVLLKNAGYRTGFVGKFGVKIQGEPSSMFDVFKPLSRSPYFKKQPNGSLRHVTQLTGDRALEFLENQKDSDQPFCLSVSFNAPHAEDGDKRNHFPVPNVVGDLYSSIDVPKARLSDQKIFAAHPDFFKTGMHVERFGWRWDTPQKFAKNMRGYWGMISGVDHVVGRIRDKLKSTGLADNTIVIFTGDNGYYLGQRGFAGKWSHYEESLRVPLVVFDPRYKGPSQVRDEMVLNVDVAPTILQLAGVELPKSNQGESLRDLIHGESVDNWRKEFFCEHLFHLPGRIPKYEGVRGNRWTYARYFEQKPAYEYLHDLKNDPDQLKNLAQDPNYAEQLNRCRSRCDELMNQWGGPYSRKSDQVRPGSHFEKRPAEENENLKPNVVLIISDDQHWRDYSFMGHPVINTPSIDQLARQSIQFNRGYVPTALCRPSLATIITGLYPRQHGITGNDPFKQKGSTPQEYQKLRQRLIGKIDQVPTIPQLLAKVGYVSFQSGKWWEGHYSRGGFTNGMTHGDPNRGGRHGDEGLMIGRSGLRPIEQFVDGALAEEKPFFLWYAPFLPHTPHNPPKRLLNQYLNDGRPVRLAKYYAMCEWFDETCGQLLKLIDDKGLRENTMIVYVTDNGWIQRTSQSKVPEGWPASYAPRSKQSPNEGGVRTPILIRWPNHAPPVSKDDLVSSVDIAPTILNACGATVPDNLPGLDLLKLAVSNSGGNDRALFGEGYAHDIADINEPSKSLLYRWVIQDEFKLIRRYKGKLGRHAKVHESFDKTEQLFHLKSDPHETKNLVNSRTELVQKLRAQLDQDWKLSD